MKRSLSLVAIALLSTTAICTSYAAGVKENDALAVQTTKISLTQAVDAAEKHVAGKASRAELEKHKDQLVFDVEVVSGNKVMDVKVDPENGKVLAAKEDKADQDHDEDRDKDDDKDS